MPIPASTNLPAEEDEIIAVFNEWADVYRSHRKLAHRGSWLGRFWVDPSTVRRVLEPIEDIDVLRAELAIQREHYNTVRLHAGIGYVTPDQEHRGEATPSAPPAEPDSPEPAPRESPTIATTKPEDPPMRDSAWDPRVLLTLETRMEHGFNKWCAAQAAEVPGRDA